MSFMITTDGRAKLIDFGLSCVERGGERPRGAIQWKSPEWLAGDGPTFVSDIYRLGMCIIQAITGLYPWGRMLDTVVRKFVSEEKLPNKQDFFGTREWELVERIYRYDHQLLTRWCMSLVNLLPIITTDNVLILVNAEPTSTIGKQDKYELRQDPK
ncbi:TKL protein kinase [Phytophthora megakarya]|uniref:TKL protein kinase n=1 Tax=Phytophthora megakarya TaxID=4795 RepID=A0A225V1U4_9STRA|nr:TKL protein kinase [Phytophthora megakarya]